uniref:TSC complex subunit 1a n=1 Tax=Esox lucius TaxID=8010 RepID=A0A3P8ZU77_ESOLU
MAKEQPNVNELLPLLESSDLNELDQIKSVLNDLLSTERGSMLVNGLVDYYFETSSPQAVLILCSVREPHDKPLLDKLNECMAKPACRLHTLTLLGHIIRKQPSWMHKVARFPLLISLLKCLKTDSDVLVLITGVLVLITLLPMIPQAGKQHIWDFFDIFGRLASWSLKNPGHVPGVYLVHLHASVYSLFHRLYGMYPCNFVSYLRSHYSMKENVDTFEEVVKPMLEHVRIHPELVTGTKDYELDPSRWKRFEIHDIVIECAKVSLDPKEASCEEGYSSMPDHFSNHHYHNHPLPLDSTASPCNDFLSSFGQLTLSFPFKMCGRPELNQHCDVNPAGNKGLMWSPSSECEMTTPPTSRGISPANVPELYQSASQAPSELRDLAEKHQATGSYHSFHSTTETVTQPEDEEKKILPSINQGLFKDPQHLVSTPDNSEGSVGGGDSQFPWSFRPCFTPIDNLGHGFGLSQSPYRGVDERRSGLVGLFSSPSHFGDQAPPVYEPLFELALPRAASLFVWRKTAEALAQRAVSDVGERDDSRGQEDGNEAAHISPLDILDRLIQHGNETYDKVLKRLPMPNKSVDWTHFGGATPLDELHTLRSQLLLLHNQVLYERYKREQHAIRNRRLLRRIINATAMKEQNNSMKAQLKMQDVEIQSLQASLLQEQQRCHRLKEDADAETACLRSQIQQLQRDHDQYLAKAVCVNLATDYKPFPCRLFAPPQELQMLQSSTGKEQERLHQSMRQQSQGLEAAQQRIGDLEAQLAKKEHLILELKKFLEDVKSQAKSQLQASECRYLALRRITQALQTEMLQLYSQLDTDTVTANQSLSDSDAIEPSSARPPTGTSRPNVSSSETVPTAQGSADRSTQVLPPGNESTLTTEGGAQIVAASANLNGSLERQVPLLSELSPPCLVSTPFSVSPVATPFTVGSYPSDKSFLGMHARELFRNKSESQCDWDTESQMIHFRGLSQGLSGGEEDSTEDSTAQGGNPASSAVAPALLQGSTQPAADRESPQSDSQQLRAHHGQGARPTASAAAAARQRRNNMRIMDYNEMQQ